MTKLYFAIGRYPNNEQVLLSVHATEELMVEHYHDWINANKRVTWDTGTSHQLDEWLYSKFPDYKGDDYIGIESCLPRMQLMVDNDHETVSKNALVEVMGYHCTPEHVNQMIADIGDTTVWFAPRYYLQDEGYIYVIIRYNGEYGTIMSFHSDEESMVNHAQMVWNPEKVQWKPPIIKDGYTTRCNPPYMVFTYTDDQEEDNGDFYNSVVGYKVKIEDVPELI